MIIRFYLICIFLCGICTTNAHAQSRSEADSLFQTSKYLEAEIAYDRIIFLNADPDGVWYATKQKVQCLKQEGLFSNAELFIRSNLNNFTADSQRYELRYEQALCAYLSKNFEMAASVSELLLLSYPDRPFDRNLVVLRILALNELQQWGPADSLLRQYSNQLQLADKSNPYLQLPKLKNAEKAQWLSTFIPGAGQLYAGKPLEATVSLLIQAAGIYFGVVSFMQHYYFSAWLVGAGVFGSFHFGGVRRAEALVNRYNQRKAGEFNSAVKAMLLTNQ